MLCGRDVSVDPNDQRDMDSRKLLQSATNARIQECVPRHGWDATVGIVVANKPVVYPLGTGTLFEVAGVHFVVTAGHVIRGVYENGKTIGITDADKSFISTPGDWTISAPGKPELREDPFDLALFPLPSESVTKLHGKRFLRVEDIDFRTQSSTAVFSLLGYPGIWATPSREDDNPVILKPLEYTTWAYDGEIKSLIGYDPAYHLLLGFDSATSTNLDGTKAEFIKKNGELASMPRDLGGISGCGVWVVGDLAMPLEQWPNKSPKVVGVETGIYHQSRVVRATRWAAVTTLIHAAFADLRPALELYIPGDGH